jgi:hypothetical protein
MLKKRKKRQLDFMLGKVLPWGRRGLSDAQNPFV